MIDFIAQWLLFLLWNLPLFVLAMFMLTAIFAWPFSVLYATFGIIIFPFLDSRKLKKMRNEREMPDLNFRTSPFNIFFGEFWQQEDLRKYWRKIFLALIAAWLVLLFFVHFLMAHVFGYPPAQQAGATTETMLWHFMPPYSKDTKVVLWIFVLGVIPVIIFNIMGSYFTDKVRKFIWDELRYDWFKQFFNHTKQDKWVAFGKEYMLLHIPEKETFQRGEKPKYRSSFKKIRWKQRDYYSTDDKEIEEDEFLLFSHFRSQALGRSMVHIRPYYYLIDYQVYPFNARDWDEKVLIQKAKALLFYLDDEKVLDIYLQVGFEKGYLEEITDEKGGKLLRLTQATQ
jgi:hypothetical protein